MQDAPHLCERKMQAEHAKLLDITAHEKGGPFGINHRVGVIPGEGFLEKSESVKAY